MEVPAPQGGTVKEVKVKVGDRVSEGDLIVTMRKRVGGAPRPACARPGPGGLRLLGGRSEGERREPRSGADRQAAGRGRKATTMPRC